MPEANQLGIDGNGQLQIPRENTDARDARMQRGAQHVRDQILVQEMP